MSGTEEPTYEAFNLSSRAFTLGDVTMLPKHSYTVTESTKRLIENHHWGTFFKFIITETVTEP
jgi:hypothetical protein